MNREDVRNLVIAATGRPDKADTINEAINMALRKISSQRLWSDLLTEATATSTIGVAAVALDSNMRRLNTVRLVLGLNSYPIPVRTKFWVDRYYPQAPSMANGRPAVAYQSGHNLVLIPAGDIAYDIIYNYYRIHPDLTDDLTEILISQIDDAVVSYATYWLFKSILQHDDAKRWFEDYTMQLRDAMRVDSQNNALNIQATPRGVEDLMFPPNFQYDPFFNMPRSGY